MKGGGAGIRGSFVGRDRFVKDSGIACLGKTALRKCVLEDVR